MSSHCSETAQSPINIDTSSVQKKPNLNGLGFTADNKDGKVSGTLTNNGHAPTLKIDKPKGTAALTGGPLGDSVYELEQLHFHFGCDDDEGSEHTVDSDPKSGEVRIPDSIRAYNPTDFSDKIQFLAKGLETSPPHSIVETLTGI